MRPTTTQAGPYSLVGNSLYYWVVHLLRISLTVAACPTQAMVDGGSPVGSVVVVVIKRISTLLVVPHRVDASCSAQQHFSFQCCHPGVERPSRLA